MKKLVLLIILALFLFSTCALEIANVIGPGGIYVFYDKGNYDDRWRYIGCSPHDFGELKDITAPNIVRALELCDQNSGGWYYFPWELPTEADLKKMLECFSYGLTKFSSDYHYLAFNPKNAFDLEDSATWDEANWEVVVLRKNFKNNLNGEVERVELSDQNKPIRVRPIRRF